MPKMKFHISNAESEKRNIFYLWHIWHGSKKYDILMSTPMAETSEKSIFAESSESGQTYIATICPFSIFPARPCCRRNKEKERKYTNGK